ncbi:(Fe-S)-binding protein [Sinisalibacter aestuarii]|uniref:Heterodisulfide reductase n=1 Tax=Sinisalibacter aestuarii TaxID=2949426 RepID=A0ABQ5LQS9_9RHOB|nr:(Fe-S)-binding protein [Sinisalibacter aestuarii]GKY87346.1 heterodisulfide reductase [Sinisalibacter aestuarii]
MTATLERGLNALREQIDAPVASFFTSCVSCGICAEACLFYKETGDPEYTPIHKLELMRRMWSNEYTLLGRAKSLLGLGKKITDDDLTRWETLVYDSCTMCGRCTMVCPVGNDITMMIRKMREGMSASGHGPKELVGAAERHTDGTSPMGDLTQALLKRVEQASKVTGIEIEVDKPNVDYMLMLSSHEIASGEEMIASVAKIMKKAGHSWTISTEGFEATNVGIQLGNRDVAANLVSRIVDAAIKLKVKTVISPECGHAFQAIRWEGPNLIGKEYPFEVKHIIEVLDQFRAEGKLTTNGKNGDRLTFHDPCQVNRRGGINKEPRRLMNMVAENFIETEDAGTMNWCCSGGGGVGANQRANDLQAKAFNIKKRQIEAVAPDAIVTMCAFCHSTLEDQLEANEMDDIEVLSLTEMMAEYLDD